MGKRAVESEVIYIRKLLPMYTKTVLQNGMYYITNHPKCRISLLMIDLLGDVYISFYNHATNMSIILEYVYSSSMYFTGKRDSYVNTSGKAGAQKPHLPLGDDSSPVVDNALCAPSYTVYPAVCTKSLAATYQC
jgi:hypothetical protein